jgi:hypothetical protein
MQRGGAVRDQPRRKAPARLIPKPLVSAPQKRRKPPGEGRLSPSWQVASAELRSRKRAISTLGRVGPPITAQHASPYRMIAHCRKLA